MGPEDGRRRVVDVKFLIDPADVRVDREVANQKLLGDLFFHQSLCQQRKDLKLPVGQQTRLVAGATTRLN